MVKVLRAALAVVAAVLAARAQDIGDLEKRISEFTLANGLHFIIAERHASPMVAVHLRVNSGSADDPPGYTGLARMIERTVLKGTDSIGSSNWAGEQKALAEMDQIAASLEAERSLGGRARQEVLQSLQTRLQMARDGAKAFEVPGAVSRLFADNGGAEMSVSARPDSTEFSFSLPSNRLELWFFLASQTILHPVFRDFYGERDGLFEESRTHGGSSLQRMALDELCAAAFQIHPYRSPAAGWPGDVLGLTRPVAGAIWERDLAPANMTVAISGDADPSDAKRFAERYFGPLPSRPLPSLSHASEPLQTGPKSVSIVLNAQPLVAVGYKRPSVYDKDDSIFDLIFALLSGGRMGWLNQDLVQNKRIASGAASMPAYPGSRYSSLFVLMAVPAAGHSVEELQKALEDIVDRLKTSKAAAATLARAKATLRMNFLSRLDDNGQFADVLAEEYGDFGNWRKAFTTLDEYQKATPEDIQRVASRYFVPGGRTTVSLAPQAAAAGGQR